MANYIFIKMFTLVLVNAISILSFYQVNGADLTGKRHSRQCATCSIDAAELLASPWYGVPQSVAPHEANKRHEASRRYRDTKDQESIQLPSRFGGQGKTNEAVIARFDLPNFTFGGKNFPQENDHERQERSNFQEFEFEGKKYALRRKKVEPRAQEMEPQESPPVESSGNRNLEYLLMLYNGIQKVMQTVDPKKTMYENFEDALFDIVRKIIRDRMTTLFEDSVSEQRNENKRPRNSGGKNEPRRSEPEQNDISLSLVAKQILEQLRSRNEVGDRQPARNPTGPSKFIATESPAGPRYENPPLVTYQENPGTRSPPFFQSPVQQPSRPLVRSAAPGNAEQSSSIFRNGRSPEIKNSNREVYDGKTGSGDRDKWSRQHRDAIPNFSKASTTLEYEAESARFARSERPTEKMEVPAVGSTETSDNSSELVKPEKLEKSQSLENLENFTIDHERLELPGAGNSTSLSEKLGKAFGEYLKADKAEGLSTETTEIITTFLDELIKFDQTPAPTTTQSPVLSHTQNSPTIREDDPE